MSSDHHSAELAARYGRTPARASRNRLLAWAVGAGIILAAVAWVIWVAFDGDGDSMETRDIGHTIVDDTTVRVSYEISVTPETTASCALEVQNEDHAIVGWKIVDVPASETYTRTFTEVVRTTELGVTGLIYRCWLT